MINRKDLTISSFLPCYLLFVCLILAGLIFPAASTAQNQVQIVEADSIVGVTIGGNPVQKIMGHVHLRTKDSDMYADQALKFSNLDLIKAFGNIEIDTDGDFIWADSLTYYTDIDFTELRGRVILESDSTTLFGNSVDYRFTNKVAHFRDKIRLEDEQGTLVANTGFYFREADSATFRGQVQLRDSLKYIEGDSLFSNRQREYYELHGTVFADNPENQSKLKSDYLEADSTGRRLLKGHAWLINYKKDSMATDSSQTDSLQTTQQDSIQSLKSDSLGLAQPKKIILPSDSLQTSKKDSNKTSQPDTTHIRAVRILSLQNRTAEDTTTTVKAYENVRIWSPDFSSLSDSSRYESKAQTFELWNNAKAWNEQTQLSGPYIWVQLQDGDIKQLDAYPNPFSVQEDTVINRLNQIKGDTLEATFNEGQLQLIRVFANSHMLRFTEKDGKPDGLLELESPLINIFFENGELAELKALQHNGVYLPESEKIANKKLDGFTWDPDLRPQRPAEKMEPRFEPIPEGPPFELPRRYLDHIGKVNSLQTAPFDSSSVKLDSLQADQSQ